MKKYLVLLMCAAMAGCAYTHHSWESPKGTKINAEQVSQLQPGKTDREWVLKNLGTPQNIHAGKDGFEVYEYVSNNWQKSHSSLIFVFSWKSEKVTEKKITRLTLRNGILESIDTIETT